MTGDWTHRLGYVVPSWNTVVEFETMRMLPAGVSAHFTRIAHTDDSPASLRHMAEQLPDSVALLSHAKIDVVCYACTGASLHRGRRQDLHDIARLRADGTPVISTAGALVDGARHLGLARVAVAAPYEKWLLDCLVTYLEEAGLRVLSAVGLGEQANVRHSPRAALDLALRAWTPQADGLILSCGNFRSLEAIADIERHVGKPMIGSNSAALWSALSAVQWRGTIPNAGRLLRDVGAAPAAAGNPDVAVVRE